jgi:hypothetical protein
MLWNFFSERTAAIVVVRKVRSIDDLIYDLLPLRALVVAGQGRMDAVTIRNSPLIMHACFVSCDRRVKSVHDTSLYALYHSFRIV